MRRFLYIVIASTVSYGLWAFVFWQLHPFEWSTLGRFGFLLTFLLGIGWAVGYSVKQTNADALSEWQKEHSKKA